MGVSSYLVSSNAYTTYSLNVHVVSTGNIEESCIRHTKLTLVISTCTCLVVCSSIHFPFLSSPKKLIFLVIRLLLYRTPVIFLTSSGLDVFSRTTGMIITLFVAFLMAVTVVVIFWHKADLECPNTLGVDFQSMMAITVRWCAFWFFLFKKISAVTVLFHFLIKAN